MIDKFNIRIYGLLLEGNKILVSNEKIDDFEMVKFPGGGLEFGEGIHDCLIREFKEELNLNIMVYDRIYITEHFIQSAFRNNEQVIALYYWVETTEPIINYETVQSTRIGTSNQIKFKWEELNTALIETLSFETDRNALKKLLIRLNKGD